jgi:hypothetical protein
VYALLSMRQSWELHRDPVDACSTRNARPYLLKLTP